MPAQSHTPSGARNPHHGEVTLVANGTVLFVGHGLADDEVRQALAKLGCVHVLEAATADDAFALLGNEGAGPDFIVLRAPGARADVIHACRRLAQRFFGAPLIAVVEAVDVATAVDLVGAGASDVVAGSIAASDLVIRSAIALRLRSERMRAAVRERRLVTETTRLERKSEDLSRLVWVDALTGLINRAHAMTLIEGEWRRAARSGSPLAMIVADLDHFHLFNEREGHLGGDKCLQQVAAAMARCLRRPTDFLARLGGEEFVAVLAATGPQGASLVAERMRCAVRDLGIPHASQPGLDVVTVSVGYAACEPVAGRTATHLLASADAALFHAKAAGRDCVRGDSSTPIDPPPRPAPALGTAFPTVTVDPSLVDRIPAFLCETKAEARVLSEALFRSNFELIRVLGHRLQATAREAGLEDIARLGARLDAGARDSDVDLVRRAIDDLEAYVDRVQVVYRRTGAS
jgi:diguanylate cyclase (GGDEF)-like protein